MNDTPTARPTRGNLIFIVFLVGLALFYLYVLRPLNRQSQGLLHPAIGSKLVFLSLQPLTGDAQPVELDQLQGKVSLINFWGTWCPPCRLEFPHIVALYKRLQERGDFQLLAVSCGNAEEDLAELRNETTAFLEQQKADLPTYYDPDFQTRKAVVLAGGGSGFGYPTTIILDRTGILRGFWEGYAPGTEKEMEALVQQLLQEPRKS